MNNRDATCLNKEKMKDLIECIGCTFKSNGWVSCCGRPCIRLGEPVSSPWRIYEILSSTLRDMN